MNMHTVAPTLSRMLDESDPVGPLAGLGTRAIEKVFGVGPGEAYQIFSNPTDAQDSTFWAKIREAEKLARAELFAFSLEAKQLGFDAGKDAHDPTTARLAYLAVGLFAVVIILIFSLIFFGKFSSMPPEALVIVTAIVGAASGYVGQTFSVFTGALPPQINSVKTNVK